MNKQFITVLTVILLLGIISTSIISKNSQASPGSINVYEPSGGNTYYIGETIPISWNSFDIGDYIKIELLLNDVLSTTISSNTSNDGYYEWIIPLGYFPSYSYKIKITSLAKSSDYGESGLFYISEKFITINSPSSGDILYAGESYPINWYSENAGDYVKIQYIIGSVYHTITYSTYNDGSYSWLIPSTLSSGSYQILITSTSDSSIYGYSEYFSIGERSITITSSIGGETWYKGETYTIAWNSENAGNDVRIEYAEEYSDYYYSIKPSTSNDGSYDWTISKSLMVGSQYKIKITSNSYSDVYDISGYFSIDQRYIDINSPRGYDKWYPNETHTLRWDSDNAGNFVDIRLYKSGVYCATIASALDNTGSYTWTISSVFSPGSDYEIEIRSKDYSSVYDRSNKFSISGRIITIYSPENDDTWLTDETLEIRWDSENAGYSVYIELYKDGKRYKTIESDAPNSGNYHWEIPSDLPPGSYQIKITSLPFREVYAYSEGNFTVEENFFQRVVPPLFVVIIIIVAVTATYKVIIKMKKRKTLKPGENVASKQQIMQPSSQMSQTEITSEDYDQIWEGNKP